jgi:hypothetical protein
VFADIAIDVICENPFGVPVFTLNPQEKPMA